MCVVVSLSRLGTTVCFQSDLEHWGAPPTKAKPTVAPAAHPRAQDTILFSFLSPPLERRSPSFSRRSSSHFGRALARDSPNRVPSTASRCRRRGREWPAPHRRWRFPIRSLLGTLVSLESPIWETIRDLTRTLENAGHRARLSLQDSRYSSKSFAKDPLSQLNSRIPNRSWTLRLARSW